MGKIIQGRLLVGVVGLRDKKEAVSVNLCGHLVFCSKVSLDENCTVYTTFFFFQSKYKESKVAWNLNA